MSTRNSPQSIGSLTQSINNMNGALSQGNPEDVLVFQVLTPITLKVMASRLVLFKPSGVSESLVGVDLSIARDLDNDSQLDSNEIFAEARLPATDTNVRVFEQSLTPGRYFIEYAGTLGNSYQVAYFSDLVVSVTTSTPTATQPDFNKDGKTDILLNNPSQGWNTAWLMDGTNYAGFANVFGSAGYRPVATADFNKDGKTDLVVNNPSNNFNSVWFMDGGNYVSGAGLPTAAGWQIKGAADFNGDGNTDILLNNTSTNWNTVWFLGGANGSSYTGFGNLPVANGWNITGVADFNGDGNSDILLNNPTQGWNSVWFLNDTTYIGFANLPSAPGWQTLGTGDFNGDSKPDIILNNLNSNWNTIWLMNGTNYAGFANLPTAPAGWEIAGMA